MKYLPLGLKIWLVKCSYFPLIWFPLSMRLGKRYLLKYNPTRNPLQNGVGFHIIKIVFYASNFKIPWPWKILKLRKMCIGATPFIEYTSSIELINYDESDLLQQNKRLPITPSKLPFNFWFGETKRCLEILGRDIYLNNACDKIKREKYIDQVSR